MVFSFDGLAGETSSLAGSPANGRPSPRSWKIHWVRFFALIFAPLLSGCLWWLILGTFR